MICQPITISKLCCCVYCGKRSSHSYFQAKLCKQCFTNLQPAKKRNSTVSLYQYNEMMRQLILNCKVHGDRLSLLCLKKLWLNSPQTTKLFGKCSFIMPAPSSLWGRLHGRIDLAWWLTFWARQAFPLKPLSPPNYLYWSLEKQAKKKKRRSTKITRKKTSSTQSLVIVDDVITTGETLAKIAKSITAPYNLYYLTLAQAY